MSIKQLVFTFVTTLLISGNAYAWEAHLPEKALTKNLILIDKGKREFFYLEKHGEEVTRLHYPSIHGEIEGDKQVEGDLKTPEGVYFVRGKIQIPLDFEMYGDHAYPINYPNPVDILKGKTGSGIWIHSKGNPIKGQVTQGCIAIDLANIKTLDEYLKPGTPVVIAEHIKSGFHKKEELPLEIRTTNVAVSYRERDGKVEAVSPKEAKEIEQHNKEELEKQEKTEQSLLSSDEKEEEKVVENKEEPYIPENVPLSKDAEYIYEATKKWNEAWAGRSEEFFTFYNPEAYSITEGSFQCFKAQKQALFKILSWIFIAYDDIEVLEGPDYFVSWFKQSYVAPNHKTEGIRRLYWMKDKSNQYKVVAMEWLPQVVGLENKLNDKINSEVPVIIESWRLAWEQGDIEAYSAFYSQYAVQDNRKGLEQIKAQKESIWKLKQPKKVVFSDMKMSMEKEGLRIELLQNYEDSSGYKDKGIKILILHPTDNGWEIFKETWRRM